MMEVGWWSATSADSGVVVDGGGWRV